MPPTGKKLPPKSVWLVVWKDTGESESAYTRRWEADGSCDKKLQRVIRCEEVLPSALSKLERAVVKVAMREYDVTKLEAQTLKNWIRTSDKSDEQGNTDALCKAVCKLELARRKKKGSHAR